MSNLSRLLGVSIRFREKRTVLQGSNPLSVKKKLTPDVNSGRETFFHAATCLA